MKLGNRNTAVLIAILTSFVGSANAAEVLDIYSYQAAASNRGTGFIQSNIEGLFEGKKMEKKISENLSFEMTRLKSSPREFDWNHRDVLENNTRLELSYKDTWFSRVHLGTIRKDMDAFSEVFEIASSDQRMVALSQGFKKQLRYGLSFESYLGMVQCHDQTLADENYVPVFGFKLGKTFKNQSNVQIHLAQEVQSGGSYTGMYGTQTFRKLLVMGSIPLFNGLSFLWDVGTGMTQTTFEEEGVSSKAGITTASASLEYKIGNNVKGLMGYSHRTLFDQSGAVAVEGHMMSATFSFVNF